MKAVNMVIKRVEAGEAIFWKGMMFHKTSKCYIELKAAEPDLIQKLFDDIRPAKKRIASAKKKKVKSWKEMTKAELSELLSD